ncbi:MAG: ATP-binding cassette domain-containing protein [Candidatus Dormibacteraeota bacterium]|uniref:ATP-binding cassette domain-containing protein n=1 Tax=Candidatus Amunia macphersoniae TaxID=3127014 RepID=A0A934NHK3_9BACT|nr:ATP-binding cassette domain-containing protein [Candidatus Dormibacteraeota bacterium]
MAPLVDIAGLRYQYPQQAQAALDGVQLRLDGGLVAVAGPSGGGKSTLLRLLNGLVPHMHGGRISGRAVVDGRDVLRTPPRRMATSVGFVFQDAERQAVHTTVERDIAFGLENLGVPAVEMHVRVDDIMDRLRITPLRDRTMATLSGGERQRVAVAGALVLRPRLLVLDEPLSQLDSGGVDALLELCGELRSAGTAVVLSEHRLDAVLPSADSLVMVGKGRVQRPCSPALGADSLDSAPQLVRLSRAMGWSPPLLDAVTMRLPDGDAAVEAPVIPAPVSSEVVWHLDDVSTGFQDLLGGVSVCGRKGEVIVVMGDNGAGKTTLLRVLAGLIPARSGTVWRRQGRIAYLPQNPAALLHRQTVAAELDSTLRRGRHPADGAHRAFMDLLGVTAIAGCDPRDLSSGQRQRAAIAAVLCGAPEIALLDEPTRGMDGAARDGLAAAVRNLAAAGASVVVATHDSDLAASIADRVFIIADGQVRDAGSPAHALSGRQRFASQLGRLFASPGPVTVEAVAAALRARAGTACA